MPESIESFKFVSQIGRISRNFDSKKDSHSMELKQRPQILIKLSFRELWDSSLYGLYPFDNIVISFS